MDPLGMVEDEVALEGLDGITIPALWIRLEDRRPRFPLKLDDPTKELVWRSLVGNGDLKFYQLPVEREDVVLYDRFKDAAAETGTEATQKPPEIKKDVYPVHILLENKDGIQGSCVFFNERKDVTNQVRPKSGTPPVRLEEALERYGRKLVVVASHSLRFRALIGNESDPDLKLNDNSYCMLERVGRARWQGELQSDLHGSSFKIDAGKLHYMRKSLVRHGLVTMQSHATRLKSGQMQHSILLQLKRFHVSRRSKYDMLMENVSNLLQQLPGQFATLVTIRDQLDVSDRSFKRLIQYMRTAKLVEYCRYPLEDLDAEGGPCINKRGNKVLVRCLKLLKPYNKKGVADDDEDEDDEEDESGARSGAFPPQGRIMEKDFLSQTYHLVLSCGTQGIPQRAVGYRMNVGKLESRMLCRKLQKDGMITGFMEDEGRQRTTKFISHKCVGVSDQIQMFAKEQERQKLLYSSTPQAAGAAAALPETPSTSKQSGKKSTKTPAGKKTPAAAGGGEEDAEGAGKMSFDEGLDAGDAKGEGAGDKVKGKSGARRKSAGKRGTATRTHPKTSTKQPPECETPLARSSVTPDLEAVPRSEQAQAEEEEEGEEEGPSSKPASASPQTEGLKAATKPSDNIVVVEDVCKQQAPSGEKGRRPLEKSHETYRLLRRKNLIIEAVQSCRIIEGFFPLQKIINEEEKQDGFSSKCCKKTILRLVHSLSREGLLKIYTTTVIQDGISKKVQMVAHPSIQPTDESVTRIIEQVRFKISSSCAALRQQQNKDNGGEKENESEEAAGSKTQKAEKRRLRDKDDDFKPTTVRGLGKTLGFQPKMHRLRVIHNFLWYAIYGHPLQHSSGGSQPSGSSPDAAHPNTPDKRDLPSVSDASKDQHIATNADGQSQAPGNTADVPAEPKPSYPTPAKSDDALSGDEEEELKDALAPEEAKSDLKVYVAEDSWKKFIPPVRLQKELGSGWAMMGDLLLCLPLSIFVQIIQINYKVDGLEEYLNDPVKQHHLVRALPATMKRQLLYKRKYIFSFYENLQKMAYMGLMQFAPVEKFKDKDQVSVYLKRNATIVDTTNAEPHYWLVTESADKAFERRRYTFNTAEDVENYWFDLMCVCLNTPLGIVRSKRHATDDEAAPFVRESNVFVGMANLLKGSIEVCDDGSTPGDGKGAAGLDSEFFAHLKRNWLWTNHLLAVKPRPSSTEATGSKIRLKSLLSKTALRIALKAGGSTAPRYVTAKKSLITEETVEMAIEPASRNQQVVGGKRQKRKRAKKEVVKAPRKKKKEPKKRTPAHDETDHQALKMMTRQRVYWSVQEDSLMMLCSVASHLLNSKLKRPFVPHCVVRDLLHAEFEISMDKTSVAVGRRSRYILKNPQTFLNYRICLAEVYQDKLLLRQLEENKPADPNNPEDCATAFSEYVRLLRLKFSSVMTPCDMNMSDTKQQLFSRFKVCAIEDGKRVSCKDTLSCTEDIHAIVLHNLIQSTLAMTNYQMKSSRSFQTFHIYSKFDQELLCQVFIKCRKRGLVNRRRVCQTSGPKKNRSLPILPMSYQLSQSYYRVFSWRFPHSLCTDAFRFLRGLLSSGTGDDRPVTAFYLETENRTQNGEETLEGRGGGGGGGGATRKEKEGAAKEDGRAVSEPQVQPEETAERRSNRSTEEDVELESKASLTAGSGEDAAAAEQPANEGQPSGAGSEDRPHLADMQLFSLDSPGGACVVSLSLMTLGLLSVHLSIPKQMVVVDSNLVDSDAVKSISALEEEDDDDDDGGGGGEECEGKKKMEVKAHQASHTKYLMMRGYCCPGIVKLRNLNTSDNIVVESCIIRLQLRSAPAHRMFSAEDQPLDLSRCGSSLLPPILTRFVRPSPPGAEECDGRVAGERGHTPEDVEACARIRRSLDKAGERGSSPQDLLEAHAALREPGCGRSRSLQQYMKDLQEEGQVLRVGGLGVRWVLMRHADPWLLTVNSKNWSQSNLPSDRGHFFKNQESIPFMRKRFRRDAEQEPEEPPAKKPAVERQGGTQGAEGSPGNGGEKPDGEDEQEGEDESPDLEETGGKRPEEKADEDNPQTGRSTRRTRRDSADAKRDEDAGSPPPGHADPNEDNLSFVSRPWRMVDGKLNRQVCKGMLEALLYHVMSRPGITQQTLVEYYKDVLQPVVVLELVEALLEMGCLTERTLVKRPKPSLFGRSRQQAEDDAGVKTAERDTVFYEPTISCCLRLSQVLPNERHWNYCTP